MAYRKTEKVQAQLAAKREAIIDAAIFVIAKDGIEVLTGDNVAAKAGVAKGLIYKYFADINELHAAVIATCLARDVAAMREAASREKRGPRALARAIMVFYASLHQPHLVQALAASITYREGIRTEIERILTMPGFSMAAGMRQNAAAGALGTILGVHEVRGQSRVGARAAVLFILRAAYVSDKVAQKVMT